MGILYICPTPLGNLEDITLRVLRVLEEVDLIAAEDTRHSRRLLAHFGIDTVMVSYHQHSTEAQIQKLVARIEAGDNVALISDAGTPGISDPGQALVASCLARGIEVDSLPGASAATTALAASGYPLAAYSFYGFISRKGMVPIQTLASVTHPVVLYESPHRVQKLVMRMSKVMPDRPLLIARELTKLHQQFFRGTVSELLAEVDWEQVSRGEFTLVLGPWIVEQPTPDQDQIQEDLDQMLESGDSVPAIARELRRKYGISRQEAYSLATKKKTVARLNP